MRVVWVSDGNNVNLFNLTAVIPAAVRGNFIELNRNLASNQALEFINTPLTEFLDSSYLQVVSPSGEHSMND